MKPILLLATLLLSGMVTAAPTGQQASERLPEGAFFRHKSDDGVVHMNRTLTLDAIHAGYKVLDSHGRVLESVAPQAVMTEQERRQQEQEKAQKRRDQELRRLYAGPQDARRARDRKIEALRLNISYEENSLSQMRAKLDEEISTAARIERNGRPVPESNREAIERLQRQIDQAEGKIADYRGDIKAANKEYKPIIQRLEVLEERDAP